MVCVTVVDGRTQRGERNREAIIDALIACYNDGSLRPSVQEVADRAGVSPRSVHNHFVDVEALRAEVAQRQWVRCTRFAVALDRTLPVPERVAQLVELRSALYEEVTPVRRAALLQLDESPTIAANLAHLDRALRHQLDRTFDIEPEVLDAVDALASWDVWNRLRRAQGCSVARARRILTSTIRTLIEGAA
jgi:TetR/AcrR family transcriptional regulator, regulator of autoinduction and epiphytic fitness